MEQEQTTIPGRQDERRRHDLYDRLQYRKAVVPGDDYENYMAYRLPLPLVNGL